MERETGKRKTLLVFKILETKHMEIEIDYRWCLCLYSFIIIYFYFYFYFFSCCCYLILGDFLLNDRDFGFLFWILGMWF